jgi:2-polyprenyl-6-methoxyphenol hydroxylase-like FAD-dependent oxidoreductase
MMVMRFIMSIHKILVVGAGIAGPSVCYWLRRFGFAPTLIEKSNAVRKNGIGLDIRGSALDVVKKMGIYDQLCAQRTQVNLESWVNADGNVLVEKSVGYSSNDDVEIMRCHLIDILMDSIKEVPCYFNQEIIEIKQNEKNVAVMFSDDQTTNYDMVIGADGLRSSIRKLAFPKTAYKFIELGSYFSVFRIPNYLKLSRSKIIYESKQKLISITVDGDSENALVALNFRSSEVLGNARDEKAQKIFIKQHFLDLGWECNELMDYLDICDDFYFDIATQVCMESWSQGRVVLVGDSGYCPSPLSGQGTSLALVGAYVLAGELKMANGDYMTAFERYKTLMSPFINANQELGMLVNETFLLPGDVSQEEINIRTKRIMNSLENAAYVKNLLNYD